MLETCPICGVNATTRDMCDECRRERLRPVDRKKR